MDENASNKDEENINVDDVPKDVPIEKKNSCFESREVSPDFTEEKEEGGPASAPAVVAH